MKERILIVDDDEAVREMMRRMIERKGMEAIVVASGEEALCVARSASFDLAVTDLDLPGIDGLTLASALLEEEPRRPVVLITARPEHEVGNRARAIGIASYFSKPFDLFAVSSELDRLLSTAKAGRPGRGPSTTPPARPPEPSRGRSQD